MLVDYIRQVNANSSFRIIGNPEFIEFNNVSDDTITEVNPVPDQMEMWASIQVSYEGSIPESYKVFNLIIGDWVNENEAQVTKIINGELEKYLRQHYPNSVIELDDTVIWLDQLDYMPINDEENKKITIEIELVFDTEPLDEDE